MKKKYKISFRESKVPITEPITKFGGQPVWIEKPEWAVSRSTGKPMMFICQIEIDQEIFGQTDGQMAYIFMTDDEDEYVDGTWEADGGENAVIIQPKGNNISSIELETGSTLNIWKEVEGEALRQPFSCEFAVEKSDILFDKENLNEKIEEDRCMFENKIGGIPNFLQFEEFPDENKENWDLLLQLDSSNVPFEINFGDAGVGYAFITKDRKMGKFLWQCC